MRKILVFDSGLGGLSVAKAIRAAMPLVDMAYVCDHAGFPYGERSETDILTRVLACVKETPCDAVVIACNTASTLVLPELRKILTIPVIGTVPAIKPACEQTKTGLVSVLATPGTVKRDYTQALISQFAGGVAVNLVGSKQLASLAEQVMRGEKILDEAIKQEFLPCFVGIGTQKTDIIVLACTHYPFLLEDFKRLAPWPVTFIDPAPAIAKRVMSLVANKGQGGFTYTSTALRAEDEVLARRIII